MEAVIHIVWIILISVHSLLVYTDVHLKYIPFYASFLIRILVMNYWTYIEDRQWCGNISRKPTSLMVLPYYSWRILLYSYFENSPIFALFISSRVTKRQMTIWKGKNPVPVWAFLLQYWDPWQSNYYQQGNKMVIILLFPFKVQPYVYVSDESHRTPYHARSSEMYTDVPTISAFSREMASVKF